MTRDLTSRESLDEALASRIVVLDGAMGTLLRGHHLSERRVRGTRFREHPGARLQDNYDLLSLTEPRLVSAIHEAYLEAGADIITTNTFRGTSVAQEAYGLGALATELNVVSARLAREAADRWSWRTPGKPRFVVGSLGPLRLPSVHAEQDQALTGIAMLSRAFREQALGLIEGGVDLLMIETATDATVSGAALAGIREALASAAVERPVMVSAACPETTGELASWSPPAGIEAASPGVFCLGFNCVSAGPAVERLLSHLSSRTDAYVSCHPSAGLPNAIGAYAQRPADAARALRAWAEAGVVNIVGGCCGTTPDHTRATAVAVHDIRPRQARRRREKEDL